MERMNSILATMLTAEIDFIVRGLDNTARSVVASRKAAMPVSYTHLISPENEDDATAEILYNILCRRASSEPFYQRVKSVLADYMASGRDINAIPVNEFYAPASIDLTHGNYLCVDGLYYAYLLVPSDGYKAVSYTHLSAHPLSLSQKRRSRVCDSL